MGLLFFIVLFCALGGVLSVLGAAVFLLLPERHKQAALPHGISFAIGALLAAAFWGLLPHAFAETQPENYQVLSGTVLVGILGFFLLEKLLIWRHSHHNHYHGHGDEATTAMEPKHGCSKPQSVAMLIIIGDGIHNFVDGVLIAAAFLTDIQLGIATSLAAAAHEIPQEVGDFAILLASGYAQKKAIIYNILASLTTIIGGMLAYFSLDELQESLPYFLALAASSFIYIAVADLIPTLHQKTDLKTSLKQTALITTGALLICSLHGLSHRLDM